MNALVREVEKMRVAVKERFHLTSVNSSIYHNRTLATFYSLLCVGSPVTGRLDSPLDMCGSFTTALGIGGVGRRLHEKEHVFLPEKEEKFMQD